MKDKINFEPDVGRKEIEEVCKALGQKNLTSGITTQKFEKKISQYLKSKYVVACSSGTSALHISLVALEIAEYDEVIIPSMSFISTANTVRYVGAKPIFLDCDKYFNLNPSDLEIYLKNNTYKKNKKTFNTKTNRQIKCIVVAHIWGNAANLEKIYKLCKKYNIFLLEDAAESFGTKYLRGKFKNKYCGTIGDIGCVSFNGNKIITAAGGGAVLTKSKRIEKKIRHLINQAKIKNNEFMHDEIGYNYRISDIQSAIGISQISRIKSIFKKKKTIFLFYKKHLKDIKNFNLCLVPNYSSNNFWMICLKINNKKINLSNLFKYFKERNIILRPVWYPLHLQRQYKNFEKFKIKNTMDLYSRSFCVPSYSSIGKNKLISIIKTLKNYDFNKK